jgi:DNA-binding CsgD family transcriptional regulator
MRSALYTWDRDESDNAPVTGPFDTLWEVQGPNNPGASGGVAHSGLSPDRRSHEGRLPRSGRRSDALSQREVAVLEEIARGTPTEEVARRLHVSPHTVRTHIKNILRKLDARTRAHAVAIALSEDAIEGVGRPD